MSFESSEDQTAEPGSKWLEGLELWLQWIMVTGVGHPVGTVVASWLAGTVRLEPPGVVLLGLGMLAGGVPIGLIQWQILRARVKNLGLWVAATAVGWASAWMVTALLVGAIRIPLSWLLAGALSGLIAGAIQARALRDTFDGKGSWILLSAVAWTAAFGVGVVLNSGARSPGPALDVEVLKATWIVGWPVLSALAFLVVLMLLPKPEKKEKGVRWWPSEVEEEEEDYGRILE